MNRQLYNMGGEGIMQVAPQQDSMPSDMQGEQYRPIAENLANDPKQAIEVIVKMLMEQGIPEEEARRIAMEMIQTVAQTGSLENLKMKKEWKQDLVEEWDTLMEALVV
jgi:hypothetical protein